jgi:hypothetical protein
MIYYKWIILCGIVVILAGATIAAKQRRRPPEWTVYRDDGTTMELSVRVAGPGTITIAASAALTLDYEETLFWHVEARLPDEEGRWRPVWEDDYGAAELLTRTRPGVPVRPRLPEHRVELPPGYYQISLELRETSPLFRVDGTIKEPARRLLGRSLKLCVD